MFLNDYDEEATLKAIGKNHEKMGYEDAILDILKNAKELNIPLEEVSRLTKRSVEELQALQSTT